jgi:cholestenol Delta-isomerase
MALSATLLPTRLVTLHSASLILFQILKRLPWRYAAVMVVSCAQLYGDVLYFMTEHYDEYAHVDWSHWLYYFVYFSMFNIVWIIIPTTLIVWAWINTSHAVSHSDKQKSA